MSATFLGLKVEGEEFPRQPVEVMICEAGQKGAEDRHGHDHLNLSPYSNYCALVLGSVDVGGVALSDAVESAQMHSKSYRHLFPQSDSLLSNAHAWLVQICCDDECAWVVEYAVPLMMRHRWYYSH